MQSNFILSTSECCGSLIRTLKYKVCVFLCFELNWCKGLHFLWNQSWQSEQKVMFLVQNRGKCLINFFHLCCILNVFIYSPQDNSNGITSFHWSIHKISVFCQLLLRHLVFFWKRKTEKRENSKKKKKKVSTEISEFAGWFSRSDWSAVRALRLELKANTFSHASTVFRMST